MTANLSLPPNDDLDTLMRKAARAFAMDIYTRPQILGSLQIAESLFRTWETHPVFLNYLRQEQEAWRSANNVKERTKLKAGVIMEEFMEQAFTELKDRKTPLNQRTELLKVLAKVSGLEGDGSRGGAGGGGGFSLQINIGPGRGEQITIKANPVLAHDNDDLHYDPNPPEGF